MLALRQVSVDFHGMSETGNTAHHVLVDCHHPGTNPCYKHSLKKCGISNALDGDEDDVLWHIDSDKETSSDDSSVESSDE